jgi:carotenoid cleavage dioxygenase
MQRRELFRSLAGAAALAPLATVAGFWPLAADAANAPDATEAAFQAQRARQPWTLGYEGLQADVEPMPLRLHGRWPRELQGAFYRNGPARHSLGGQRYHHAFDGDGMLQRYTIRNGAIVHQGRFVRTEKFVADSAAGHPVRAAFATNPPGADEVTSPDAVNAANISVLQHGGELMALWEGGSATLIDPQTLATRGPKVWSPDHAGMAFSAHPKIEPDGTLWNFGVTSYRGLLSVYRIQPGGALASATTMAVPNIAMVHDFAVTGRHLVFLLPPLVFDTERARNGSTFLDAHVWKPELGMRVLVLPKDALDQPQWFELPAGFVFHLGNAWEDAAGVIRLDCVRSPSAWHAMSGLQAIMRGEYDPRDFATITLVTLDTKGGRAHQTLLPHVAEFPRVDPRVVGRRYQQVFVASRQALGDRPGYDAVMRLDLDSGSSDSYRYGSDVMVEEHVFVPRPHSKREGDGWLVGTALDLKQRQMLFSVFDARKLAAGPIAQGALPRVMPLGLHGIFVPA